MENALAFIREKALGQISDDLLTISPSLGKSVNNLLMNTLVSSVQAHLSPSHFAIMKALNDNGEAHMSEVAYWLSIPRPQMTRIVDKLVGFGYVEREIDTADRRSINIKLTTKGIQVYKEWVLQAVNHMETILNNLTDEELNDMADSVSRFRYNITQLLLKNKNIINNGNR